LIEENIQTETNITFLAKKYPYLKNLRLQKNPILLQGRNRPYKWVHQKTNEPFLVEEYSIKVVISEEKATPDHSYIIHET